MFTRIVIVSKHSGVHNIGKEIARETVITDESSEAVRLTEEAAPDVILFDNGCPPGEIRQFLESIHNDPKPPVIVVTASEFSPFATQEYERAGASRCLSAEQLIRRASDIAVLPEASGRSAASQTTLQGDYYIDAQAAAVGLVGRSGAIRDCLKMIRLVAESRCNPVLITGETGTGKEVAARAIHYLRHPGGPFVDVNCAALTATLLESELFGHVRGAFTGADHDKMGLLELAATGTIFLDEISEMPPELQAKLLRVIQERTFRKVGGLKDVRCQATIIASSNRDLKQEVREKRFRQDLYYRLNICPIGLASLRVPERRQDISLLAKYFVETSTICHESKRITSITPLALEALLKHDWPGNIRELRNVIDRALLLETTDRIGLSSIVIEAADTEVNSGVQPGGRLRDFSLEKAERELIARALQETDWQKTQAASLLGITRATLYAKVKQYNIQKEASSWRPPYDGSLVSPPAEPAAAR